MLVEVVGDQLRGQKGKGHREVPGLDPALAEVLHATLDASSSTSANPVSSVGSATDNPTTSTTSTTSTAVLASGAEDGGGGGGSVRWDLYCRDQSSFEGTPTWRLLMRLRLCMKVSRQAEECENKRIIGSSCNLILILPLLLPFSFSFLLLLLLLLLSYFTIYYTSFLLISSGHAPRSVVAESASMG